LIYARLQTKPLKFQPFGIEIKPKICWRLEAVLIQRFLGDAIAQVCILSQGAKSKAAD
jgi:hypothetical protein